MARKGILSSDIQKPARRAPAPAAQPRGTVGALQSSLTKLQENAVQEIAADLIDDAGVEDRLGVSSEAQNQLKESLATYGQQVPVLLRPHAKKPGRFEIVYGRRRLRALKDLGMPVKAMIRQLDDHALIMAQGQENTARQDLSFIEKASFAAQLDAMGYERQTITAALSVDLPMLSRLLKVGKAFDLKFLRAVGAAPGIGRDRWMALVKLLDAPGARSRINGFVAGPNLSGASDERFEQVFARAVELRDQKKPAKTAKARTLRDAAGNALGDMRANTRGVTLNIKTADGFSNWIEEHAETVLQELHDRWQKERSEG